ncbi:uncharacterized protein LOC144129088 [Amblyomma americanum]
MSTAFIPTGQPTAEKGNGESEEEASSSSNPDGSRGNRARQGRRAGAARGARPGREAPAESGDEPAGGLEDSLKGAAAPGGSRGLPARRPEGRRGRLRGGRIARGQLHADIAMSVGNEDEVAAPTSSLARRARQAGQAARFPQGEKNKIVRQHWIANLERKDFNRGSSSRVCSVHFIDGRPTKDNPYPTLHLGTPTVHHNGIRKLARHDVTPLEPDACSTAEPLSHHSSDEQDKESASADHHLPINVGTEDLSDRYSKVV